jgi:YD repeat-containing protein
VTATGAGTTYTYDSNGNLTQRTQGTDTWTYSWNAENQLTKVEKNGAEVARFAYDAVGRRVEKVTSGLTTSFTYDAEDILREVRGASTVKHVHGPGIDAPLAAEDGSGALTYLHADALGSIVRRTSPAGVIVDEYGYDVWGSIDGELNEPTYSFTGREWDPEVGLYYYRARYYDPKSEVDPVFWTRGLGGIAGLLFLEESRRHDKADATES